MRQVAHTFCDVHDQVLTEGSVGRMKGVSPAVGTAIPVRATDAGSSSSDPSAMDHNPAAAYVLFDASRRQITFCRVAYDAGAAADKIRKAGLPGSLAARVELGI
jgi:hypothetical protein